MKEFDHDINKLLEENRLLGDALNEYKLFFDLLSQIRAYMDSVLDKDKTISLAVNKIADVFNVNKISCMLLDEWNKELFVKASQGISIEAAHVRVKLGEPFCGQVAQEGNPLLVKDVCAEFPNLTKNRLLRYSSKSFIIVPLKIKDKVRGVLSLTDKKEPGVFTEDNVKMLTLVNAYLALYIENGRLIENIDTLSALDSLTNLFTHRYFHEQLLEEIYRAERYDRPLSLIMLDIDDFSVYNQTHGYLAGDNVLKQMSKLIKENTRQTDLVSRYGPEDFAIILPETSLKDAVVVGEKIKDKISSSVFTDREERKSSLGMSRLTVSVGVVEHKVGLSKEELMHCVTCALLEAKQKGKNCVSVFK